MIFISSDNAKQYQNILTIITEMKEEFKNQLNTLIEENDTRSRILEETISG